MEEKHNSGRGGENKDEKQEGERVTGKRAKDRAAGVEEERQKTGGDKIEGK